MNVDTEHLISEQSDIQHKNIFFFQICSLNIQRSMFNVKCSMVMFLFLLLVSHFLFSVSWFDMGVDIDMETDTDMYTDIDMDMDTDMNMEKKNKKRRQTPGMLIEMDKDIPLLAKNNFGRF